MTETYRTSDHNVCPLRSFEDLQVGEVFPLPSRTMTDGIFAAFQAASGDNHPIHYDVEYCRRHGHDDLLAHGMQVFIQTAAGAGLFPHMIGGALVGMIEASFQIRKPVLRGDTLYSALTIADLQPQTTTGVVTMRATVHNQNDVLVMEGQHKYLLRLGSAHLRGPLDG